MNSLIWVKFQRVGFHRWKDAPDRRAYLRDLHRHIFQVRVAMDILHNDREVEFHDLLEMAEGAFYTGDGTWSCEMMAEHLAGALAREYHRRVTVEVSEDGECGAIITVT